MVDRPCLFPGLLASVPKSPILIDALEITQEYYEKKYEIISPNIGIYTLQLAYDKQPPSFKQKTQLMKEILLTTSSIYPALKRRKNQGCCCNYVVHDGNNVFFLVSNSGRSKLFKLILYTTRSAN